MQHPFTGSLRRLDILRTVCAIAVIAMAIGLLPCCAPVGDAAGYEPSSQEVEINFTLPKIKVSRSSSETWDQFAPQEEGNELENYVSPRTLRILIYKASDNSYVGSASAFEIVAESDGGSYFRGRVRFAVDDEGNMAALNPGVAYKFMAFANCPQLAGLPPAPEPADVAVERVAKLFFERLTVESMQNSYIPMWGVSTVTVPAYEGTLDIGGIDMLRSMAKIEISLGVDFNPGEEVFAITGVEVGGTDTAEGKVNGRNSRGYYVPRDFDTVDRTGKLFLDPDNPAQSPVSFNPLDTLVDNDVISMPARDGKVVFYLPEYVTGDRYSFVVALKGDNGSVVRGRLFFASFNDGQVAGYYDKIIRNHWYRFNITAIPADRVLEAVVQVVPYGEVDLKPDFGIDDGKGHFVPIEWDYGLIYYDPETGKYYDESKNHEIENPFNTVDPGTGHAIISDDNTILYYNDVSANVYYLPDNYTQIKNPYSEASTVILTDIVDGKEVKSKWTRISTVSDSRTLYYYNPLDFSFRAPDGTTEVTRVMRKAWKGVIQFTVNEVSRPVYYYSIENDTYYTTLTQTGDKVELSGEIPNPFSGN